MPEFEELIEKRFRVVGVPVLTIENVAGETDVRGTDGDEVVVRARKRVQAESADAGKRMLDYLIETPRRSNVSVRSASGDTRVRDIAGTADVTSVSGDVALDKLRGVLSVKTVSGDARVVDHGGTLKASAVSGDLRFVGSAWTEAELHSVSGDIAAEARLDGDGPFRVRTVSSDVELSVPESFEAHFSTVSGDLDAPGLAKERIARRKWVARRGKGGARISIQTVSGDATLQPPPVSGPPTEEVAPATSAAPRDARGAAD